MCRGREDSRNEEYLSEDECLKDEGCVCEDDHHHGSQFSPSLPVSCELCDSEAIVYCQADDAFLCGKCDKRVHAANFLAQRHIRCFLCTNCHFLTHRYLIGVSVQVLLPTVVSKKEFFIQSNEKSDVVESNYSNQLIRPFLFL